MAIMYRPEFSGKNLSELPSGASGYESKTAEQTLNEMNDAGVVITEAEDFMRGIPQTFAFPKVCNPLDYLNVKNQRQKGACAGFTLATVGEMNFWVASGGKTELFSGDAMYVLAQEEDGIRGDRGSTPQACAKVAQTIGLVPESLYGQTVDTYNQLKPVTRQMREAAADYKLKSIVRLKTYDQIYQFLGGGLGAVQCCSKWQSHFDRGQGNIIESFFGPQRQDSHGGGHSYTLNGYDQNGNVLLTNSWDKVWRDDGAALMTRRCIDELLQDEFSFVLGYSNMETSHAGPPPLRRIPVIADDHV